MIGIVYAAGSKVRRRTVVTDSAASLAAFAAKLAPGEAYIECPVDELRATDDGSHPVDVWLAARVGSAGPDRVVEIDANGVVVSVFKGDPEIDGPVLDKANSVELHETARVGATKVGGIFVDPVPVEPVAEIVGEAL